VPAAEEHADVVGIAGTGVAAWQAAVEDALDAAGDPEAVAARQAVAAANTWDARVEQLEALLAEALAAARQF
jgi:hypothetical protein